MRERVVCTWPRRACVFLCACLFLRAAYFCAHPLVCPVQPSACKSFSISTLLTLSVPFPYLRPPCQPALFHLGALVDHFAALCPLALLVVRGVRKSAGHRLVGRCICHQRRAEILEEDELVTNSVRARCGARSAILQNAHTVGLSVKYIDDPSSLPYAP